MIKLKNIAERVGLGVSTVSAVLNGKEYCYVSESKKQLIHNTAREMGYVPNRMSRGIQGLPTNTIGIIGSLLSVPVNSSLIDQFSRLIDNHGYSAMLGDSRMEVAREKILINEFLARGVDGLLIQSSMKRDELEAAVKGRMPFICFGHDVDGLDVTMDRCDSAFIAVEHLITAHLHRKIGFITTGKDTNLKKYNGYRMALEKYKIEYKDKYCFEIPSELAAIELAGKVITSGVTAVFCSNDFIAGYLIKGIVVAGKRVPEDIAVIGFDGLDIICDLIQPSLTSVKQPVETIARMVFELLMQKLNAKQLENKTYYIDPVLRIGQSCGCNNITDKP